MSFLMVRFGIMLEAFHFLTYFDASLIGVRWNRYFLVPPSQQLLKDY